MGGLSSFLTAMLLAFAVYRLASLVASEEGPYLPIGSLKNPHQRGVFLRLRELAHAYDQDETGSPPSNFARGVQCPLCVGMYAGVVVLFLSWLDWTPTNFLLIWLAVTGMQVFLVRIGGE